MKVGLSIAKGKGNIKHNERTQTVCPDNINQERSIDNLVLVRKDIQQLYKGLFDESVQAYNDRQKRNDRKIKDYYQKINKSKQEKSFHELIVQIGNKDEQVSQEVSNKIYMQFVEEFIKNNPNLHVFSAIVHNDEATPHLHLDYVPTATGYKKGMQKRVSNDRAIQQQGYTDWRDWKDNQFQTLEAICNDFGIERHIKGNLERHLSVKQYKEVVNIQKNTQILHEKNESLEMQYSLLLHKKTQLEQNIAQKTANLEHVEQKELEAMKNTNTYEQRSNELKTTIKKKSEILEAYNERLALIRDCELVPMQTKKTFDKDFVKIRKDDLKVLEDERKLVHRMMNKQNSREEYIKHLEKQNMELQEQQKQKSLSKSIEAARQSNLQKENQLLKQKVSYLEQALDKFLHVVDLIVQRFGIDLDLFSRDDRLFPNEQESIEYVSNAIELNVQDNEKGYER